LEDQMHLFEMKSSGVGFPSWVSGLRRRRFRWLKGTLWESSQVTAFFIVRGATVQSRTEVLRNYGVAEAPTFLGGKRPSQVTLLLTYICIFHCAKRNSTVKNRAL
jgi:hypothetical protein